MLGAALLALAGCDPTNGGTAVAPAAPASPPPPGMQVDLQRQQVFLPGSGWLRADEFWDLYYHHPERLPGNLDSASLAQLPGDPRHTTP